MRTALRYLFQVLLYAPLAALLGYFSTEPPFTHLPPEQALVRLSFTHASQRREACRERSADELAKLAPNMHAYAVDLELAPGGMVIIDFNAARGGFEFRT